MKTRTKKKKPAMPVTMARTAIHPGEHLADELHETNTSPSQLAALASPERLSGPRRLSRIGYRSHIEFDAVLEFVLSDL